MTSSRADIPRLAASLGVLGTELEQKGQVTWDRLAGWTTGPTRPAATGERGGGGTETDAEDRRDEQRQARRASEHHAEYVTDLAALDALIGRLNRRLDMACPPDVSALRNRRTGEFAPETKGDIAAAGYCVSCWRNDKQMVVREKAKGTGLYYSPTLCRWCADVKRTYGIEPPMDILKLRHAGRRISAQLMEEAVAGAKKTATAKSKKRRKGAAA